MNTPDKELIDRVIAGQATKKEAREVVEWFSDTTEGQAYLSELINSDAHLLDLEGVDETSLPPSFHRKSSQKSTGKFVRKKSDILFFALQPYLSPL